MRVLLVDDHAVVRQSLARLLETEPDIEVVGEAADGKTGVALTKALDPDVVLMDVSMPVMNGIEATRILRRECPRVSVIGLSMFTAAEQTATLLEAGAVAYVSKADPPETLVAAMRRCPPRTSSQQPDLFARM